MSTDTRRPPCPLSPKLAFDIHRVVRYAFRDPENYCIHVAGPNRDVALRALRSDSTQYLADVVKVTRWVLFVINFKAEARPLTAEDKHIREIALRLNARIRRTEPRERKDAAA